MAQTAASVGIAGGAQWKNCCAEHSRVVKRSASNRGAGGQIGQQQSPCGRDAKYRRQRVSRVGVERSRRSGEPREPADAKADQQHGAGGQQIDKPCGIAGQGEDQRNGERRGCAGRDGRDRLRQCFHRSKHAGAQAVAFACAIQAQTLCPLWWWCRSLICLLTAETLLTARWWPRSYHAARRWAQRCGWDCRVRRCLSVGKQVMQIG